MALSNQNRVLEKSTTTGTGTYTLAGTPGITGFNTNDYGLFSSIADGSTVWYAAVGVDPATGIPNNTGWEVGLGTVGSSGTTLARTTIYNSTNSDAAVSWSAGTRFVFCTLPAQMPVYGDDGSSTLDPGTLSPIVEMDPDTISGSDGDAISTVASGGTAASFDQATSGDRPILKKGVNGLDSHNVIRFVSTDYLEAATGAASLATDWTVYEVRKRTGSSDFRNCIAWGDATTAERRSPHFEYNNDIMYFIGQSADVASSQTLASNTWYILATTYNATTDAIKMYVNGTLVANSTVALSAYASTAIRMGVNLAGSEPFIGDHAYLVMLASEHSSTQVAEVVNWLYDRFPSVPASTSRPIAYWVNAKEIGVASLTQTVADGNMIVFGDDEIVTTNTASSASNPAAFSVYGSFASYAVDAENEVANNWTGQNTLSVWNKHTSGFSAVRFRRTGTTGEEMAAIGYGRDLEPWGMATDGSTFWETSNFNDASKNGVMRLIQTKASGGVYSLRMDMQEGGSIVWYQRKNASGDTLKQQMVHGQALATVADNGVLTTAIITPAFGMLVVRDATNAKVALYKVESTTLTSIGTNDAEFTTTKDSASKVNVYAESNLINVQNKTGGSLDLAATFYGA